RDGVDVIVTDVDLPDGMAVCREAKRLPKPPAVLVITEHVERVPDALEARCDGVLLKPFAPNLLVARIGRLIRARTQHSGRPNSMLSGTNRFWPKIGCPSCETQGVTS